MKPRLSGIFAALLTPRDASGKVDYELHDTLVDFVLARGVDFDTLNWPTVML